MKYQISIILSILTSLTFGCEVTHPVDPAFDNCRQAGGTWKDQKCLCPNGIDTVCRKNKLFTCSFGVFDQGIDCPGVCKDDKVCVLELDNIACNELSLTCNYMNINDQNLYVCNDGKLVLNKVCKKGCIDNKCVAECDNNEKECVGMYEKVCSKEGFWEIKNYCPWGCYGNTCKCPENEEICYNDKLYKCVNGKINEEGSCNNTNNICNNDDVKCTNGGMLLKCTNGNWLTETHAVSGICKDDILTNCKEVADGFVLNRETCEKGCDETGKSCKQASDNPELSCENGTIECTNNTLKICKNGQWEKLEDCGEKGCKDNNSCHSSTSNNYDVVCSDGELTCIDMELKICEQGQWQLKEKCNDDSGTDMGFCYIDQCIKCEEIIGVECIGNMQSQIMCQTSEGRIPTQIDCAFGCTSNNDGYCEPCSESMPQKCESNKEYQCFNGMWQYTKTCALGCNDDNTACNEPTSPTQTCDPKVDKYEKCDMNNTAVVKCINGQWEPIENCGDNGCVNGKCGECMAGQKICSSDGQYLKICTGLPAKYETIECTKGCEDGVCIDSCQTKSISCSFELGSPIFKTCNDGNVSQFICDKCQSDLLCDTIKSAVDCSNNLPTNIECDENNNIKCIANKLGCIMDNQTKAITICKDQTISINAEYPNTYVGWYDLYEQYAPDEITDLNNVFLDNIFELNELTSVNKLNMCKNNQKKYSITRINENSSYNREDRLSDYIFCIDDACDNCINSNTIDTMIIERVCSVGIDTHWGNLSNYK